VLRLAGEFEAHGSDAESASYFGRLVESFRVSPEIVARMDDVKTKRPHHVTAAVQLAELMDAVRPHPDLALQLALAELRSVRAGVAEWTTDFQALFVVLRSLDPIWLDALIDLVPEEPAVRDGVESMLRASNDLRLIVDRLGLERVAAGWLAASSSDEPTADDTPGWWAMDLVMTIEEWADEDLHRAVLLRLVDDATDEQLWHVAAGPLEDFLTDDSTRLDWMEQVAAHDPRFRAALAGVWTSGKSPVAAARIAAVAPEESEI
jgi:hypothetical protein